MEANGAPHIPQWDDLLPEEVEYATRNGLDPNLFRLNPPVLPSILEGESFEDGDGRVLPRT